MKHFLALTLLICSLQLLAFEGRIEKSAPSFSITQEVPNETIKGDSCKFYLQISNYYFPREIDSIQISVFYKTLEPFPSFEFFHLETDSTGMIELTYLPGKYYIQITKKCTPDFKQNFDFKMEKIGHSRTIYSEISGIDPNAMLEYDKPVIYCYPKKELDVEIKLTTEANLTFTYPHLNESWKTTLHPNGDIEVNNKKYPYLFWEGQMSVKLSSIQMEEGFVVDKANTIQFFENKLAHIGLNQKEITDFITYWCPKMNADQYQVQFLIGEEYNANIGKLTYSIQPDTEIRIYALIKEHNGSRIKEQTLPQINRKGFTVVEWGGSIVPLDLIKM